MPRKKKTEQEVADESIMENYKMVLNNEFRRIDSEESEYAKRWKKQIYDVPDIEMMIFYMSEVIKKLTELEEEKAGLRLQMSVLQTLEQEMNK